MFNHMVEQAPARLDAIFHALGDPTRRAILRRLADDEHRVGALAAPCAMSLAAASKHIRVLEAAGLVAREIRGRSHVCRLNPGPLASAHAWIGFYERFWIGRLDILDGLLRQEPTITKGETP